MSVKILYVFIVLNCTVFSVSGRKHNSSVAFVVDRTNSMSDVINYVKRKTHKVFDEVINSNSSTIDDFILVAFDDPRVKKNGKEGAELLSRTFDKDVFEAAIDGIKIVNGGDCPEYSMTGIEKALQYCKPNSFIYVFTDAAPADYEKLEKVKTTSQEKNVQVNFLLTGMCKKDVRKQLTAFENITQATSGQIFNIVEEDTSKIINYIIESVKGKRTILSSKNFQQKEKEVQFTVDSKIADVMISVSSPTPTYQLTDADGISIATKEVVHTRKSTVDKMQTKPGNYFIRLNNLNESAKHSVVVSGVTTVLFQYGFSLSEPRTFSDTKPQPFNETIDHQYLSIELENEDKDVLLETAELRDLDDKVLRSLSLKIINEEQQLYVTEPFLPPFDGSVVMFKIAIIGFTKSRERITRVSTTSSQYVPPYTPPKVSISPEGPVEVNFEASLTLTCRVQGSTKLTVEWTDEAGSILPSEPLKTLAIEYNSVLKMSKVNRNMTVTCTAKSENGEKDVKSVEIKTKENFSTNVTRPTEIEGGNSDGLEADTTCKDMNKNPIMKRMFFQVGERVTIHCTDEECPKRSVTWLRNNMEISSSSKYEIVDNNLRFSFSKNDIGKYTCKVYYSTNNTIEYMYAINIYEPLFIESPKERRVVTTVGRNLTLDCIVHGLPKPVVKWMHSGNNKSVKKKFRNSGTADGFYSFILEKADFKDEGNYTCSAEINEPKNEVASITYEVYVRDQVIEGGNSSDLEPDTTCKDMNKNPIMKRMFFQVGEMVTIHCTDEECPKRSVTWLHNNMEISSSSKYEIVDNNLRFNFSKTEDDKYTCKVYYSTNITIEYLYAISLNEPLFIESPKERRVVTTVGRNLTLDCIVHGLPKPSVKWMLPVKAKPRKSDIANKSYSYFLDKIKLEDEGNYTCHAEKTEPKNEVATITYEVYVIVSPNILQNAKDIHRLKPSCVVGDLVFIIDCETEGNPKPKIMWYKNGLDISKDTERYEIKDSRLYIKNITLNSQGSYICNASNEFAYDSYAFNVDVNSTVDTDPLRDETVTIGSNKEITCKESGKFIRWFKNGTYLKEGNLIFTGASARDSGVYTCRASDLMTEPINDVVNVIVGRKPEFVSSESTIIQFENGKSKILDCTVRVKSKPKPKITWMLDSTILKETSMIYNLTMTNLNIGTYKCIVKNALGNVTREFHIRSEACPVLEANKLGRHLPLIISRTDKILTKKTLTYYETVIIYCPKTFILYGEERLQFEKVSATCIKQSDFKINGKIYNIAKVKCDGEIKATYRTEGKRCNRGNATELVQVGFTFNSKFRSIFDTCIDKDNNRVHFTKFDMHPGVAKSDNSIVNLPSPVVFDKSDLLHLNFDVIYDCQKQLTSINDLTGKRLSKDDKCCFGKRQLVPPLDVALGLPQEATFCDVNVAPVWSSCRFENWDEVERRVRSLVQKEDRKFEIWTGSSHPMLVKAKTSHNVELSLDDRNNHQLVVPTFIWKVVIDRKEEQSLAIVLVNLPNVKLEQIPPYTICNETVCSKTVWMDSFEWQNVEKGFVFCCNITEFEEAFDYKNMFKIKSPILV